MANFVDMNGCLWKPPGDFQAEYAGSIPATRPKNPNSVFEMPFQPVSVGVLLFSTTGPMLFSDVCR